MRPAEDCPVNVTPDDSVPLRCRGGSEPKEAAVFLRVSIHVCAFAVCGEAVGSARRSFTPKMIMTW